MRILIDLQGCQSGSRFGGIGRYSMALAKAMLQLDTPHEICLLLNSRLPNENAIRAEFASLMPQQNILTFEVPAFVAADNDLPAHTRMAELIREKRIAEINPDVLHIGSLFEGAGEDVVTSVGMLFPAERTAVTLYDLIPYLEQETYLGTRILADHYMRKFEGLKRAGMIVSISDFSRAEALAHTDIPPNRIANISSAVDSQFTQVTISTESKIDLLRKCGISKPFLMFTGSFDIRKNHRRLVQAFAQVPAALRSQHQLVIVGKGEERQVSRLKAVAKRNGLSEEDLVFVGHVTDVELVALYNLCTLFVFPSLREGFGLPVLEAMSCGVPTIGSNRTSIPEVIGRADALFDPEDVDDIASKITAVLGNAAFAAELKRRGLERSKNFSWALSAKRALEFFESRIALVRGVEPQATPPATAASRQAENRVIYEKFLAGLPQLNLGKLDEEFVESTAQIMAANEFLTRIENSHRHYERRIGWVTAWSPQCELAMYSQQLINELPVRPTVFAEHSEKSATADSTNVIRCWRNGEEGDLSDLQRALGNAPIDLVVIQYGQGMFGLLALAKLVVTQKKLNRHVFVTLHSTAELAALTAEAGMLEIRGAMKSCDGIFVHAMNDVKNLGAFKVRKNVYFLPKLGMKPRNGDASVSDMGKSNVNYFLRKIAFAITSVDSPLGWTAGETTLDLARSDL